MVERKTKLTQSLCPADGNQWLRIVDRTLEQILVQNMGLIPPSQAKSKVSTSNTTQE